MFEEKLRAQSRSVAIEAVWYAIGILRYRNTKEIGSLMELAEMIGGNAKERMAIEVAVELIGEIEQQEKTHFRQLGDEQVDRYIGMLGGLMQKRYVSDLKVDADFGRDILQDLRSSDL